MNRSKRGNKAGKGILSAILTVLMAFTLPAGIPARNMESVQAGTALNNPRKDSSGVVTWDCVYFGRYPQSDVTGQTKDPIKWRVLSVDGNDAFLVADTNLDAQRYNDTYVKVTWETCTMRSWLNGYGSDSNVCSKDYSSDNFIDRAFTASEQNAIKTTTVVNADHPEYNTEGGNDTTDKVFLLSYDEVTNQDYGFSSDYSTYDEARDRKNTAYVAKGGTIGLGSMNSEESKDCWWLRSLGCHLSLAMYVSSSGTVNRNGDFLFLSAKAVCPALHLNLSSYNTWSYAGTVSSTGGDNLPSGGEDTPPDSPKGDTSEEVQVIKLSGISKKIAAGKKIKLTADIRPTDAVNKNLTWTSSNPKYAAVNSSGVVTTKKAGAGKTVTITAKAADGSGVSAGYKIKIVKHAVKGISLNAKSKSVKAGKKINVKASVKTTGKTANKTLVWTSGNTKDRKSVV